MKIYIDCLILLFRKCPRHFWNFQILKQAKKKNIIHLLCFHTHSHTHTHAVSFSFACIHAQFCELILVDTIRIVFFFIRIKNFVTRTTVLFSMLPCASKHINKTANFIFLFLLIYICARLLMYRKIKENTQHKNILKKIIGKENAHNLTTGTTQSTGIK